MSYKLLTIASDDGVASLSFNRPESGNALSVELMQEIIAACNSYKYDTDTRVIVFRGEGAHFSVGADLKDPVRQQQIDEKDLNQSYRRTQLGRELIESILNINQITIAAVHGAAAGGAACIVSACDFRIGSTDCIIGYPEVKLGMNLSWGALPLCYNLVGPAKAKRMVIGGELESAGDLLNWGFLDEVVERELLEERVGELAKYYAIRPPIAAQMIKRGLNAIQLANSAGVMHADGDQFTLSTLTEDFKKQRQAFLTKKQEK